MRKKVFTQRRLSHPVAMLVLLGTLHPGAGVLGQARPVERPVLYTAPGMEEVVVRSGLPYKVVDGRDLTLDLYYPPRFEGTRKLPAVICVFGYPDSVATNVAGAPLRQVGQYTSWSKLVSVSGLVAVTYATTQPEADLADLIRYLQTHADELGLDAAQIGLWACSANVPVALSFLMREPGGGVKAGVFYYGLMTTPDGYQAAVVDSLVHQIGFAVPKLSREDRIRADVPLLVVRAGQDAVPTVNPSIDHFAQLALSENVPITLINYAAGRHAFDVLDDTLMTREIIRQTLEFLVAHLQVSKGTS